jgi:hypothetical protein
MVVMVTDKVPSCGGILNSTTDKITSLDLDKDGLYDRNLDCRWNIVVGENKVIIFTVEGIDIEYHPTCDYDYLEVCSIEDHLAYDYDYLEVCLYLRGHRGLESILPVIMTT